MHQVSNLLSVDKILVKINIIIYKLVKGKMLIILWHIIDCEIHPYFREQKWKQKICNVELMNYIQHCLLFFVSFKFTMADI